MTRMTSISTAVGLLGLVIAMLSALSASPSSIILMLGFAMMTTGVVGAVISAAAALAREGHSTR